MVAGYKVSYVAAVVYSYITSKLIFAAPSTYVALPYSRDLVMKYI